MNINKLINEKKAAEPRSPTFSNPPATLTSSTEVFPPTTPAANQQPVEDDDEYERKAAELMEQERQKKIAKENYLSQFILIAEDEYREIVHNREDSDDEDEYRYKEFAQLEQTVSTFQSKIGGNTDKGKKSELIKSLVSQKKKRFVSDEFNLDLTCTSI